MHRGTATVQALESDVGLTLDSATHRDRTLDLSWLKLEQLLQPGLFLLEASTGKIGIDNQKMETCQFTGRMRAL